MEATCSSSNSNNSNCVGRRDTYPDNSQTVVTRAGRQTQNSNELLEVGQAYLKFLRLTSLTVSRSVDHGVVETRSGVLFQSPPKFLRQLRRPCKHTLCLALPIFGTYIFWLLPVGSHQLRNEGRTTAYRRLYGVDGEELRPRTGEL